MKVKLRALLVSGLSLALLGTAITQVQRGLAEVGGQSWSYGGEGNPTQWGRLQSEFALCETGRDQSPIDIDAIVQGSPSAFEFKYSPSRFTVVNNGHTIQVNYPEGNQVRINGEVFNLLQFHFHTPSEHTFYGEAAPMEVHLVHQNSRGQLGVIGVMMVPGKSHPAIDQVWKLAPESKGEQSGRNQTLDPASLLPRTQKYYSYDGSLTTPPCSEKVLWHVMSEPIEVASAQIKAFEQLFPVNARPIQPTNGRLIKVHQ